MANHKQHGKFESALRVNEGIPQPPSVNLHAANRFKHGKRHEPGVDELFQEIVSGNRIYLSKAITLIESSLESHQEKAQQIIGKCLPYTGSSIRIGITGVPGVGKSTFIEAFGRFLTSSGHKVAVLAIDPSSSRSKGSILGDKTRMEDLSVDPDAFIRPSPAAGTLGGVTRKTRESIVLCEAAGFDIIIIETVGVGQSETTVHSMVDFFLLLMLAGAGDELQGIKRGIMEMADGIIINKADNDNIPKVNIALTELRNALHFFPPPESGWDTRAGSCSARTKAGIPEVWEMIRDYVEFTKKNDFFYRRRLEQSRMIMIQALEQELLFRFYHHPHIKKLFPKIEAELKEGKINAYMAAKKLLDGYTG
jgi:LAO/AO transport system kinase